MKKTTNHPDPAKDAARAARIEGAVADRYGNADPRILQQIEAYNDGQPVFDTDEVFGYIVTDATDDSTVGDILVPVSIEGFANQVRGGMSIRNAQFFPYFWDAITEAENRLRAAKAEKARRQRARKTIKPLVHPARARKTGERPY